MSGGAPAILLLGPTGSGKTPLGELLDSEGLAGRECHHFDFGECLRAIGAPGAAGGAFTSDEITLVRGLIESGALLEDEDFPVARRIFEAFVTERQVRPPDLVVLNGLPRHVGQAVRFEAEELAEVGIVVYLSCVAEVVLERVRADAGGDRAGRDDDGAEAVRRRVAVFAERTAPLVKHYRASGVPVIELQVGPATSAGELRVRLEREVPSE